MPPESNGPGPKSAVGGSYVVRGCEPRFGEFVKGGKSKTFAFEFTNTGDAPLVLVRAKSSCRCIEVELPKRPIAPDGKGQVVVRYVPKDAGVFNKGVEIFANIPGGSLTLFVKGNVK